ncbi:CCA tRNA nucleotidyltransferase [Roseococcus sp. SYP-B2431]|uniref:CCA tRNA nucleotidyltransferase n=1 Tax=Roseococcus sp. SYP-B2431 TaxID=2496640 RepID=UPI001038F853|nr:CCA tRNA nucleotidyltransferase [Roseococcus sp. SYP-B2431]TCH99518.1 CCA tRNA nucleotidyltransferase [Roseococcus sp. SYP-B2431]
MSLPDYLSAEGPRKVFAALPDSRAVGGCVRDSLAGLPVRDLDMAAPFPPRAIADRLKAAGFKVFETGLAHGTVTAVLGGVPIEVTSLRRDIATDGRHAEVEWTTDWREDAERRDFTINAMSMGADGVLHDEFGGRADLAARRVRFVGDAAQRLREDYLRALRFFRFHARYGGAEPDPVAVRAIREAVPGLARLSAERVWSELKRLMEAEDPRAALRLMAETGVLPAVLPEAGDPSRLDAALARGVADVLLRVAMLLPVGTDVAALASRLKLSGEEAARLRALHAIADAPGPSEREVGALRRFRAAARLRSEAALPAEILLVAAAQHPERDYGPLLDHLEPGPGPAFPLQGRDAVALGVPHGPRIGRLLGQVRDWWLETGASADHAASLKKLRELVERDAS